MSQQSESNQVTSVTENIEQTEEKKQLSRDELKEAICKQLEYYFSRQNLSTDHYLVSQMNHDLYVPVSVIANFKMIKTLTNDLDLICESVKNSNQVIIDETNKKLKPNIVLKRNTVIIRDIPPTVAQEEILKLFPSDNQPLNIHSDIGNTWFTSFETEEKTMEAVQHLKTQKWNDSPIQARVKTESLIKSVGTNPTPTTQNGGFQQQQFSYNNSNNRGGNRKFNNSRTTGQQQNNGTTQQPKERSSGFNRSQTVATQQTSTSGQNNTTTTNNRTINNNNTTTTTNTTTTSNTRGGSARGGRSRSNSGSRGGMNGTKPTRQRKDMLNLSSTKSFPPLPKMNEGSDQVGYGSQKFLRYSKQTVMSVYMEQQEKGEHNTKPEILIGECIAILKESKKDLELHKPQMDKSALAIHTIPPEAEKEATQSASSSAVPTTVKPTNLSIPRSSFAEAAITAKDIKTPDTPSTSHFFAKTRKRRGSNAPGYANNATVTHTKPHYTKPQQAKPTNTESKPTKVSTESTPSINVTVTTPAVTTTPVTTTTTTEQPISWVSVVASTKK